MSKYSSAPTKTKSRYDEDEDEEEALPRRRSRRDEVKPAKLKRRTRPVEDDGDEDDSDDERGAPVASGWKGVEETKAEGAQFADDLKLTKEPQVIKFLSDAPREAYRQHWVERKGKKSFVCFGTAEKNGTGKDCPLCAISNPARAMATFQVVLLSPDEDPVIRNLVAGPMLTDQIKTYHNNPKSGPINKMYYALSITGKKQSTSYPMLVIKPRDLREDYDIEPLSVDERKTLRERAQTFNGIYRSTYSELQKIAKGSVGEDDDDDD